MKKKVKDIKVGEIVIECKKHISCIHCPFNSLIPCHCNFGVMKEEELNKKVNL